MAYLNFLIDLALQSDGKYCITVQSSPVGEATVTVENPFTPDDIAQALAIFGRTAAGVSRLQETQAARQFGQRLFNFLIRQNDDINAAYFASLDRAGTGGLRLRLSVEKAGALATLPWELLCDPNRDFLALSRVTPVVRYTQQLSIRPPVPITMPLRVLVMIAAPSDFPALDVGGEWQRLQESTAELQKQGLIQLERLDTATLIALQRRLRAEDYHVFHFIGHSDFDAKSQEGVLVLESEGQDAKAQLVGGSALGRELGEESTIRLIVLNSCQSGRRVDQNPFAGTASSLVARGVPAVVAMQFPISDGAATVFAEEFYRAISESLPIDSAVSEARRAIANRVQNTEWATPVLYMRSEDGVLFRPTSTPAETLARIPLIGALPLPTLAALGVLLAILIVLGARAVMVSPPPSPTPVPTAEATEAAGLPNLLITSIRSSPARPVPGQPFRLLISIRNMGEVDSGPFTWTWDAGPSLQLRNAYEDRIDNIAPGASQNRSFPYTYGWWGSYSSRILVDVDSEVAESDERDNLQDKTIDLDPASPFSIDFTLLPNNEIVTPPRLLNANAFGAWNLSFALNVADAACAETQFNIVEVDNISVFAPDIAASPECAALPLAITLRSPVSNVLANLIPSAAGEASAVFYSDIQGTQPVFTSETVLLVAGEPVQLGATDGVPRRIRRVDIDAPSQPVRISTLTLFPPAE